MPRPSRKGQLWLEGIPAGDRLRFFEGSVTEGASLGPFLSGCEAIVNIAGLTRAKTEEGFMAVNAGGAVNLVETALALPDGPRHMISMSSLGRFGALSRGTLPRRGRRATAAHALREEQGRAGGRLARLCGRMNFSIIRAPGVYGPRDRDFLQYFKLV